MMATTESLWDRLAAVALLAALAGACLPAHAMTALGLRVPALCLLLALSACANMSGVGGNANYACKAPEGVACDSVSGTYANALRHNLPGQRAARSGAPRADEAKAPPLSAAPSAANDPPGPLRAQARVLRLWVKPWEDTDGDLHDQGYVYVQVDNGRWLIDHLQRRIREAYAPLKAPPVLPADPVPEAAPDPPFGGTAPAAANALQRPPFAAPVPSRPE